jgi:hypothetical protein
MAQKQTRQVQPSSIMKTPINPHCRGRSVAPIFLFLVWLITLLSPTARAQGTATLQITCPTNVTIWTCSSNVVYQYPPPAVTGSCTDYQVICSPPSGSLFDLGINPVTCRVFGCQTSDTCTFTVTVRKDTEAPEIRCPTNMVVRTCPTAAGGCGGVVPYPAPSATDNSGSVGVVCSPPSGSFLPCGVHTVTCRAEDRCGNKDECQFTITVEPGGQAPGIQCPTDRVILTCSNSAVLVYPPPVVNPAGTSVTCNPPPGTVVPLGNHIVTCVAVNTCGTNDCKFTVSVRQVPPLTFECPTAPFIVVAPCHSNCVPVVYPIPVVANGTVIECNPPSGTCFPVGDHPVVCRASNQCETVSCTFFVRVLPGEGQPPGIQCPTDRTIITCSNAAVLLYPAPVVNPPGTTVVCVPPSGTVVPLGIHPVTCVASNACGTNQCSFKITVRRDTTPPDINCPSNIVICVSNNVNGANVNYSVTATDNADPSPTITCNPPSGSFFPLGSTVVMCRAVDDCGNEARCFFTVSVLNDRPPHLSIKRDGRYVIICWPKTCSCYRLQYARNLNRPIVWTDVAVAPDDSGDSWCVRVPADERHRFFRLIRCDQSTAPVFDVTGVGLTPNEAGILAEALNIPRGGLILEGGAALFIDPLAFQAIPTKPIQDPALIDELSRGSENDKGELAFEAIDFAKLREIRAVDGKKAIDLFETALRAADLLPANGDPVVRHSLFEATDTKGEPTMPATPIDTQVEYNFDLGGVPLIGPGAKLSLALSPEGKPTALHFMTRQLKPAQDIPIISLDEATRRCAALYPQLRSTGIPRLVYYAPSLGLPAVQKVIPCFECGGSAPSGEGELQLLRAIIPATDDPTLVPAVQLDASADGTLINAKATVNGGTPPYLYQWTSSSAELSFPPDASSIEYNARPRADAVTETVKIMITDANGMTAQASKTLPISGPGAVGFFSPLVFSPAVGGVTDYGCERGVSDLCAAQQSAFNARFAADGIFRRFNWAATTAWERDFKEGSTGLDHLYVDNVDMTFYMGHGSGAGFTFENNHDDTQLHYNDVVGAWGDIDLEWLALLSCSVIADSYDGKTWAQRWGPAFSGLHLMLGFANTAYDEAGFGGAFANWTLGYQLGFTTLPPMPIRSAWFLAHDGYQPASVFAAAMGVIGPDGLSNYNDYFWGKGSVGPDIRGTQIHGYWRVKHD